MARHDHDHEKHDHHEHHQRERDEPLFDAVRAPGVGFVLESDGSRVLVIATSREEAVRAGLAEHLASQLFDDVIGLAPGCTTNYGWFSPTIKCDNTGCAGTCWVQVNKYDGLGWIDETDGSAVMNPNWAYRCHC
jgi:hypothetical protein